MFINAWVGGTRVILGAINRTIRELCSEGVAIDDGKTGWQHLTEEELLYEACVCIFGSQMIYEVAVAAADRIRARGLLAEALQIGQAPGYKERLVAVLSIPLEVEVNGIFRKVRPRFKNRLASLLESTVQMIYKRNMSLRMILCSAQSSRHARELLVEAVWGFGPKQASLFLRRIGFCSSLAVLDTHVLHYLRLARGIDPKPGVLSRLSTYEKIEAEFKIVAEEFGYSIGSVDLAMWITMRVAKREAML